MPRIWWLPLLAAAAGGAAELPNAGFEAAGAGGFDAYVRNGWQPETGDSLLGLPNQWSAYQWGDVGAGWSVTVEQGAGRQGSAALRALNRGSAARAGAYSRAALTPGTWRLAVWARTAPGQTGSAAIYLANTYSRPTRLSEQWRQITVQATVAEASAAAEVNLQSRSSGGVTVWFDDVTLELVAAGTYHLQADDRADRPRTLLFSPINVNYLRDHAREAAGWGFRGFLFDDLFWSWGSDVWAVDKDPASRGEDDRLLAEVRACNEACRAVGIDSNFVKVAFYQELPDWFDDAAWAAIGRNFREGARFAKLAGCLGVAIDTEYIAQQYSPDWPGYQAAQRPLADLKAKVRQRWQTVIAGMYAEWPELVLLTLPEGMLYYGELYGDLFQGFLAAAAAADAPGGLHIMTEGTYHTTDPGGLAGYPGRIDEWIADECPEPLVTWWRRRGSVVLGAWPMGYYREVHDAAGKMLGYSGRQEQFGDQIVGSYADKSAWYSPEVFAKQMAGLNSYSPRFNWIYGHGCVWWQYSEADKAKYTAGVHQALSNALLPTAPNLAAYAAVIRAPQRLVRQP
ncbi:MAG: hypothetical protein IT204_10430 [Fimbriimonadaceae bacterium]|nr:hypothetical protein [Fimbriimonadaceae bacterium]